MKRAHLAARLRAAASVLIAVGITFGGATTYAADKKSPVISTATADASLNVLTLRGVNLSKPPVVPSLYLSGYALPLQINTHAPGEISAFLPVGVAAGSYVLTVVTGPNEDPHNSDEFFITLGVSGPQGPQGPAGPQGAQGTQGATGPQGVPGLQGATGPTGAQGLQGVTGPQGPQGPQGNQGLQGATGAQGPAGPAGADGATGPQGPQGPEGAGFVFVGPFGVKAPSTLLAGDIVSHEGSSYLALLNAPTEVPGANPASLQWSVFAAGGAQGAQGPQGATGPQGAQGLQGDPGPTGPIGHDGIQGPQGIPGPAGPSGVSTLNGDVVGAAESNVVAKIQGRVINPTPPTEGQVMIFKNGAWTSASDLSNRIAALEASSPASSARTYRWATWSTYDQTSSWLLGNDANLFGGVPPSIWTDGSAGAYQMNPDKKILGALFNNRKTVTPNSTVMSEQGAFFSSTNGRMVGALFRVRNTTNAPINWQVVFWFSAYGSWNEAASATINGNSNFYTTTNCSSCLTGVTFAVPPNRVSTVIFVSASGIPFFFSGAQTMRATVLAFTAGSLQLPAGLEFVDDLDTSTGSAWAQ